MSAGSKILAGLKDALRYARCRHEYTVWEPINQPPDMMMVRSWKRICTKCKVRETRASETEPN